MEIRLHYRLGPSVEGEDVSSPDIGPVRPGSVTFVGLKPTSSLRRLHGGLDLGQQLVLPVIALSTDAVLDTYVRLTDQLLADPEQRDETGALVNAWTIVDWANRLRVVISRLRGLEDGAVPVDHESARADPAIAELAAARG